MQQEGACGDSGTVADVAVVSSFYQEIEKLQSELESSRARARQFKEEADRFREGFETEKAHWLDEKEKVIRYQKQLQLNYVQMYRRNKTLEGELDDMGRTVEQQVTTMLPMALE